MSPWPTYEELPPLPAETVCALLPMIGVGNAWRSKAKIVGYIGSFVGGTFVTAPELGEWLGLSAGRTRVLLAELARERVLLRDGGDAKHPRIFWCEVHPNVLGWLKVDWGELTNFELRRRLALHATEATPAGSLKDAVQAALDRLDARPLGARCHLVNARFLSARWRRGQGASSRGIGTRDDGGGGGRWSRGQGTRDEGGEVRAFTGRAVARPSASAAVPPALDDHSAPGVRQSAAALVDKFVLDQVVHAVMRRAHAGPGGRKFMAAGKRDELAELVLRYDTTGATIVEAAYGLADRGQQVPQFIADLAAELAGGDVDEAPAVDREAERRRLEAAIRNRRAMLEVYQRTDSDEELIESCRDELAECETALAALDQEGAA